MTNADSSGRFPPKIQATGMLSSIRTAVVHQVKGRVAAVVGEHIEIEGMTAPVGAICRLVSHKPNVQVRVIGFRENRLIAAPLEHVTRVAAGDVVQLVDFSLKLKAGNTLAGRIIDAFGQPIDGQPLPTGLQHIDADRIPPSSMARPPINQPLQTGVRAIDAMLTCGKGQRVGVFAGSGVGKSTLLGMLAKGSSADRIVVAMVGERGREVQEFTQRCLGETGLQKSIVVVATADAPAAQRVAAASTATAIAESFRDQGDDVLLLFDSVTRLAMAHRELGLAAGELPATSGYPPSVFNHLSRLVERTGRTTSGSITAFYSVLVEGDDINEPIADALRGMLDGHIVLDRSLAAQAHWPPINVGSSVSRSQPHVTPDDVRMACNRARQLMSDYQQNADLISLGAYRSGANAAIDDAIRMQPRLRQFLQQDADAQVSMSESRQQLIDLVNSDSENVRDLPAAS